jgi:hypothetical protein
VLKLRQIPAINKNIFGVHYYLLTLQLHIAAESDMGVAAGENDI